MCWCAVKKLLTPHSTGSAPVFEWASTCDASRQADSTQTGSTCPASPSDALAPWDNRYGGHAGAPGTRGHTRWYSRYQHRVRCYEGRTDALLCRSKIRNFQQAVARFGRWHINCWRRDKLYTCVPRLDRSPPGLSCL